MEVAAFNQPEMTTAAAAAVGSNPPSTLAVTLMQVLLEDSAPQAIWWLPGGKEFAINSNLFPSQVLEVHFPGCKYASFIRRLHKMGFSRETRTLKKVYGARIPSHAVAFCNPKFQKDRPELAEEIRQIPAAGKGEGKAPAAKKTKGRKKIVAGSPMVASSEPPSEVGSPMNLPVAAAAPVSSVSFLNPQLPVAPAFAISSEASIQPSVAESSIVTQLKPPSSLFASMLEDQHQNIPMAAAEPLGASSMMGGLDSAHILEYIHNLRQQRAQAVQEELFFRRVEEERQRREQEELFYQRVEQERQLLLVEEARQQQQQELQMELARRQLLASAMANSSYDYTGAAGLLQQQQAQQQQANNNLASLYSSSASAVDDNALLRLQLLQRLQQQGASGASYPNAFSDFSGF